MTRLRGRMLCSHRFSRARRMSFGLSVGTRRLWKRRSHLARVSSCSASWNGIHPTGDGGGGAGGLHDSIVAQRVFVVSILNDAVEQLH